MLHVSNDVVAEPKQSRLAGSWGAHVDGSHSCDRQIILPLFLEIQVKFRDLGTRILRKVILANAH